MKRSRMLVPIVIWLAIAIPSIAQHQHVFSAAEVAKVDRLLQLIQGRLDQAPGIAEIRWRTMARIEDSASEHALLNKVRIASAKVGLDGALAVHFAEAQIEAGKIIQVARHRHWATDATLAPRRDSNADPFHSSNTEPELGPALLTAVRDAASVLRRRGGRQLLDARAADLIRVGGPDLLAGPAALRPLYEIAN